MSYMENALENLPERDSSGSRNTSCGPLSSISGSATPTEELLSATSKHSAVSSTFPESASKISSSVTNKQTAHADFDFSKQQNEEEFQNIYERQRRKSCHSSTVKSPITSKGRVSFETDLSVATPGVRPLDLHSPTSSVTPISSSQRTPVDSPRYAFGDALINGKSAVHSEVTKVKHHFRSSSAPKSVQKYPGNSAVPKSKSAILHANISTRDKTKANRETSNRHRLYDMDMKHFEVSVVTGDIKPASNQNLVRVNSESYIPTPEMPRYEDSPVRGATSLNEIKYLLDEIKSTPQSYSRHNALESQGFISEPMRNASKSFSGNNKKDDYYRSRSAHLVMSEVPLKCHSLPNVADAVESSQKCDQSTHHNTTDHDLQVSNHMMNRGSHCYKTVHRQDSSDSLLSDVSEDHMHVTSRNKSKVESNSTYTLPTKPKHTTFTSDPNFKDSQVDLNISDTDSVKSFASTSSITSFRHALAATVNTRYQTNRSSRVLPVRVPVSDVQSVDLLNLSSNNSQAIQRPKAMVTRHTQMPSPGPSKMAKSRQT